MQSETKGTKIELKLDLRLIVAALLAVIVIMLFLWQPWRGVSDRTVEVTGQAKITAVPDEFVFYPSYQFKSSSKETALAELTKKSDAIVSELKKLGVADNEIKTNSSGYDYPIYYLDEKNPDLVTYNLQLTVTVDDSKLAQKVQDYLVTTTPTGSVSPQANFSDAKRKELESKARDEATKEARAKAVQSAKNLGFSIGGVKTITDGTGFGSIYPTEGRGIASDAKSPTKLSIQPGQNDLQYSVTVVYYIR